MASFKAETLTLWVNPHSVWHDVCAIAGLFQKSPLPWYQWRYISWLSSHLFGLSLGKRLCPPCSTSWHLPLTQHLLKTSCNQWYSMCWCPPNQQISLLGSRLLCTTAWHHLHLYAPQALRCQPTSKWTCCLPHLQTFSSFYTFHLSECYGKTPKAPLPLLLSR